MGKVFLILFLLTAGLTSSRADQGSSDSLLMLMAQSAEHQQDTLGTSLYYKIAFYYYRNIWETDYKGLAKKYIDSSYALALRLNYKYGMARALAGRAFINIILSKNEQVLNDLKAAQAYYKELNNTYEVTKLNLEIGFQYRLRGDYKKGLEYMMIAYQEVTEVANHPLRGTVELSLSELKETEENYSEGLRYGYSALRSFEKTKDSKQLSNTWYEIGYIHYLQEKFEESLSNYEKAWQVLQSYKKDFTDSIYYFQMKGDVLFKLNRIDEALELNLAAVKYAIASDYSQLLGWVYTSIGKAFEIKGVKASAADSLPMAKNHWTVAKSNYQLALKYFSLDINQVAIAESFVFLGGIHYKLKEYDRSKINYVRGLAMAQRVNSKTEIRNASLGLSLLDSIAGNFKSSFKHYGRYMLYRDSIDNVESARKSAAIRNAYEFEKKEDEMKLLITENKSKFALTEKENQKKNITYATLGFLILTGGYGFYHFRKKRMLENRQAIVSERLRISRELHDEVGATLSGISMYSYLTTEQIKNSHLNDVRRSLEIMKESSAETVAKLNDIVWLVNPDKDSLQQLVSKLVQYALDMGLVKNMKINIETPDDLNEVDLPLEFRRHIYLFCKEAINNAVKYSEATHLNFTVKQKSGYLEFSISDNGRGFDEVLVKRGNGLVNMQKRADELNAKLSVSSEPGKGAHISLQLSKV